jgi:hypothetical protein
MHDTYQLNDGVAKTPSIKKPILNKNGFFISNMMIFYLNRFTKPI